MERFIKEYANHKKKVIIENTIMQEEKKKEALKHIENTLNLRNRGFITIDEAMRNILNCFDLL